MTAVMIDCPTHGLIAVEGLIKGVDSTMSMVGGSAPCPQCGRMSPIVDASYTFDHDGAAEAVLRPTPAQARRLLNALTWAQEARKESDADEARIADQLEHTLRKEVPAASGILDKFKGSMSGNLANWLGVVIALISLLISVESSFSEHDLEQILQQTVQQLQNERTPAAPADSTPAIPSQAPESPGPGPAERKG